MLFLHDGMFELIDAGAGEGGGMGWGRRGMREEGWAGGRRGGMGEEGLTCEALFCLYAGYFEDVSSLVERANKDVAIEALLNTFEEVWLSRQLELRIHRRSHDSSQPEVRGLSQLRRVTD